MNLIITDSSGNVVQTLPILGDVTVALKPSVPQITGFSFLSRFNIGSTTDAQGVAVGPSHVWVSSSSTVRKYTKAGALVIQRNLMADAPTNKDQINGLCLKDGILYVSCAKNVNGAATSWVAEYNPDTLTPLAVHPLSINAFSEGLQFAAGHWWVCFHASKFVARFTPAWTLVDTHALSFSITGPVHGYGPDKGYDALVWNGDDLLLNIHEIYDQANVDRYRWTGSSFVQGARLAEPTTKATQGMCQDPSDQGVWWFVERNYQGEDSVCRVGVQR